MGKLLLTWLAAAAVTVAFSFLVFWDSAGRTVAQAQPATPSAPESLHVYGETP